LEITKFTVQGLGELASRHPNVVDRSIYSEYIPSSRPFLFSSINSFITSVIRPPPLDPSILTIFLHLRLAFLVDLSCWRSSLLAVNSANVTQQVTGPTVALKSAFALYK